MTTKPDEDLIPYEHAAIVKARGLDPQCYIAIDERGDIYAYLTPPL